MHHRDETCQETLAMQRPYVRFTVRRMMAAVAAVALVLGMLVAALRWFLYPHITVTVFNETGSPLSDVRVSYAGGERTAERIMPCGIAASDIQSYGESTIFFS